MPRTTREYMTRRLDQQLNLLETCSIYNAELHKTYHEREPEYAALFELVAVDYAELIKKIEQLKEIQP